jgi:hypothetical protein
MINTSIFLSSAPDLIPGEDGGILNQGKSMLSEEQDI